MCSAVSGRWTEGTQQEPCAKMGLLEELGAGRHVCVCVCMRACAQMSVIPEWGVLSCGERAARV